MARKTGQLDALILALARGNTVRAAAKLSGFSERQAHRHAAEPSIKAQVAAVRAGLVNRSLGILSAATSDAAFAMKGLLKGKSEPVRLAAARAILETAVKLRDSEELAARIEQLEQRFAAAADRSHLHIHNGRI